MDKIPPTLAVAIWSLRSIPIMMALGLILQIWQGNITANAWPDLPHLLCWTLDIFGFVASKIHPLAKDV